MSWSQRQTASGNEGGKEGGLSSGSALSDQTLLPVPRCQGIMGFACMNPTLPQQPKSCSGRQYLRPQNVYTSHTHMCTLIRTHKENMYWRKFPKSSYSPKFTSMQFGYEIVCQALARFRFLLTVFSMWCSKTFPEYNRTANKAFLCVKLTSLLNERGIWCPCVGVYYRFAIISMHNSPMYLDSSLKSNHLWVSLLW